MSNAYQCDRCGRFGIGRPASEFILKAYAEDYLGTGDTVDSNDLCPPCSHSLAEWFDDTGSETDGWSPEDGAGYIPTEEGGSPDQKYLKDNE